MARPGMKPGDAQQRVPPWRQMLPTILPRIALPGALLALALVLPSYMFDRPLRIRLRGLGPDAWPMLFLHAIAITAVLWIITEIWNVYAAHRRPRKSFLPEVAEAYSYPKAVAGICLIVAFGWLLPNVGFAIAATGFALCWCVLGGFRNPVAVILVAVIGMITLLWLFMGLALMPLSRGVGMFDDFSVWFLRLIRIY